MCVCTLVGLSFVRCAVVVTRKHGPFKISMRAVINLSAQIAFSPWNALLTWRTYLLAHFRTHKGANGIYALLIMERDFLDASGKLHTRHSQAAFMALSRFFSNYIWNAPKSILWFIVTTLFSHCRNYRPLLPISDTNTQTSHNSRI